MIYKRKNPITLKTINQVLDVEDFFQIVIFQMLIEEIQNTFFIYYKHFKTETCGGFL